MLFSYSGKIYTLIMKCIAFRGVLLVQVILQHNTTNKFARYMIIQIVSRLPRLFHVPQARHGDVSKNESVNRMCQDFLEAPLCQQHQLPASRMRFRQFVYLNYCHYYYYYCFFPSFSPHSGDFACVCEDCIGAWWYISVAGLSGICIVTTDDSWPPCALAECFLLSFMIGRYRAQFCILTRTSLAYKKYIKSDENEDNWAVVCYSVPYFTFPSYSLLWDFHTYSTYEYTLRYLLHGYSFWI